MKQKKFIVTKINEYSLVDNILDRINKSGTQALNPDEKKYLQQYNLSKIDRGLENWLLSDDEETFDDYGNKLLYDEFKEDEDIFYNYDKLKRIITKHLNKHPFTNNADWGGAYVWNIKSNSDFIGIFIYLGDDELVLLERNLDEQERYSDRVIAEINNPRELYKIFLNIKKGKYQEL